MVYDPTPCTVAVWRMVLVGVYFCRFRLEMIDGHGAQMDVSEKWAGIENRHLIPLSASVGDRGLCTRLARVAHVHDTLWLERYMGHSYICMYMFSDHFTHMVEQWD